MLVHIVKCPMYISCSQLAPQINHDSRQDECISLMVQVHLLHHNCDVLFKNINLKESFKVFIPQDCEGLHQVL